ncbi:MAG: AEC family transporter [Alphaproteobacteria bacterium]|nr:AEC family transporter [Alphaproteobacteria bacterium]
MGILNMLLPVLAPVLACVGVGYGWARVGAPVDPRQVRAIITNVGTPCLVFGTLVRLEVPIVALLLVCLVVVLALVCFTAIALPALRLAGLPASPYLTPLVFGNLGNMGLPLCFYAFGEVGLELAIAAFAIQSTLFFTLGVWFLSGRTSPRAALTTPAPWAIGAAVLFLATGAAPPQWLTNTVELIGGLTIPLMLITLGITLARLAIVSVRRTLALSFLRLAMGVAVGLFLVTVLAIEGEARGVVIILCAMPSAVFNYLMALYYDRKPEEVASLVVAATFLALVTLPFVVGFAMSEAGLTHVDIP